MIRGSTLAVGDGAVVAVGAGVGDGAVVAVDAGAGCGLVVDSPLLQAAKGKSEMARIITINPGIHLCSLLFVFMLWVSFFDMEVITQVNLSATASRSRWQVRS